jgi:hypothetical protein
VLLWLLPQYTISSTMHLPNPWLANLVAGCMQAGKTNCKWTDKKMRTEGEM